MQKVKKNKKNIRIVPFLVLIFFIFSQKAHTQEISIVTGKTDLGINEKFTITILFPKENKREFKAFHQFLFPEIADFEKEKTIFGEEEDPKTYKITQYYKPRKTGNFTVNSFRIKIKDKLYSSKETSLRVSSRSTSKNNDIQDPKSEEPLEFEASKLEAIFEIQASKKNVYVGEGFGITLYFLVAIPNKAEITFIDLAEQRKELVKKMKTTGTMVEDFPLPNKILLDTVTVKDKKYTKWKLYEGVFFPINSNNIQIPALNFSVLTYALAKNKEEDIERKTIIKQFYTKPLLIKVNPLPINNENDQVPVGNYRLRESTYPEKFHTGKSFKYQISIVGEGNITTISEPIILTSAYFDIYAPKVAQEITLEDGKMTGIKSFIYYITPKEPGEFRLADFFQWSYFNSVKRKMDTLRSTLTLKVQGESLKNNYISVNNRNDFYSRINTDSNQIRTLATNNQMKFRVDIAILVMLVITAVLVLKK
ncbi:MAG TPA: BatD family protein [Cytophagaceae bacterium]|nr:BatD family protein [Cytophagaceae bacterium]